ncbi:E3 ubiquitin-protein ligase Ubr3 [Nymphon striatum]|nr:E3 ubiquitin-protein ligase Ubr3 [Nymphon striatum]
MANFSHVFMRKGKKNAAEYVLSECQNSAEYPKYLNEMLDILLDPLKSIDDWEMLEWLRWLMAAGRPPEEFSATVRRYDTALSCGLVWTANFVAYRCRTCGISPCMSLCAECFQKGDHRGHDFNMFRSQAGGACDCGDPNVMKPSGFCENHQNKRVRSIPNAPHDLLCVAEAMFPRILYRFLQYLRDSSKYYDADLLAKAISGGSNFIKFLHELSDLGAAMQKVITSVLLNPQEYQNLDKDMSDFSIAARKKYEMAKDSLAITNLEHSYNFVQALRHDLEHETILEELLFWTVKYEFPQKLVCFLLNMLPDHTYKEAFTSAFVNHYGRIASLLCKTKESDALSNHVVHVSVQLFSNDTLSLKMCQTQHLLHTIIISLKGLFSQILVPGSLTEDSKNFHCTVNCGHRLLSQHCYWPLVSDLTNVFSHKEIALMFLQDDSLITTWLEILEMLQGMNVNKRELEDHIEFEPNTYYAAFSAEIETSASPLWSLLSHLRDPSTLHLTKNVLNKCTEAIQDWFIAISSDEKQTCDDPLKLTFHLPLQRYFSVFVCVAIKHQGAKLSDIVSVDLWKTLLIHPLRAQVGFYEIINGLWVRNGIQMKGQAITYIQSKFCNSMVDPDIYLLQLCAMNLEPDFFLSTVVNKFNVAEWFTFLPEHANFFLDLDQERQMLLGFLTFLATIISVRNNTGMSAEEILKQEMVTLLCMSNRTHSQLMDLLPEKYGGCDSQPNRDFESTLQQVADYVDPNLNPGGSMSQGMYVPKSHVWEHYFDPVFTFLRAVHRRDYQASLDRFSTNIKKIDKYKTNEALWPPYRIPKRVDSVYEKDLSNILFCNTMYGMFFVALYKILNQTHTSDHILPLIVYFIEIAVTFSDASNLQEYQEVNQNKNRVVPDKDFQKWFTSKNFLHVIQENISRVYFEEKEEIVGAASNKKYRDTIGMEMFVDWYDFDMEDDFTDLEPQPVERGPEHMALQYSNIANSASSLESDNAGALVLVPGMNTNIGSVSPGSDFANNASHSGEMNTFFPISSTNSPTIYSPTETPLSLSVMPSPDNTLVVVPFASDTSFTSYQQLPFDSRSPPRPKMANQSFKALPFDYKNALIVNESILSLLIKIHCKLSDGKRNSYVPLSKQIPPKNEEEESRIGDGPHFIGQLLNKISRLIGCNKIESICRSLWPPTREEIKPEFIHATDSPSYSGLDKEERRRRARDRQQKLMAEFASRQKAFMQQTMETDPGEDGGGSSKSSTSYQESLENQHQIEYDCVICSQTMPSTLERPIGLVTLLQASSVLGHSLPLDQSSDLQIPCSESDEENLYCRENRSQFMKSRIELLSRNFSETSWQASLNIGWEGGVHARSCYHYLHLDCHKSYMQSLKVSFKRESCDNSDVDYEPMESDNETIDSYERDDVDLSKHEDDGVMLSDSWKRIADIFSACRPNSLPELVRNFSGVNPALNCNANNSVLDCFKKFITNDREQMFRSQTNSKLAVDRGEYWCPLCRQLANTVLPCYPNTGEAFAMVKCRGNDTTQVARELADLIANASSTQVSDVLRCMMLVMEDITNATYPQFRSVGCSPDSHSLLLFVCSIARMNLELELIHRGGTLLSEKSPKSCFSTLFKVLASNIKLLRDTMLNNVSLWSQLTGLPLEEPFSISVVDQEVPLLLQDPVAIIIKIVLALPPNIDKAFYNCITQAIYNLTCTQALVLVSYRTHEPERLRLIKMAQRDIQVLSPAHQYTVTTMLGVISEYLGASSLYLDDHDIKQAYKNVVMAKEQVEDFVQQYCLSFLRIASLLQHHLYSDCLPSTSTCGEFHPLCKYLGFKTPPRSSQASVSSNSCTDYYNWTMSNPSTLLNTWCQDYLAFFGRSSVSARTLLNLPLGWKQPSLLKLPQEYHTIFQFYHGKTCTKCYDVPKDPSVCLLCGTVSHSVVCGAGTAIYMAVNSSTIIVIRDKRACIWGSVYLDTYGEEDRDLKRGKPLYLCKERYALLEHQWLTHTFDNTNKHWIWHKDNL